MIKVPKDIRSKMHLLADLSKTCSKLSCEINDYFESLGYNLENLRCGNGESLDELEYGNGVTDIIIEDIENGKYDRKEK